MTNDESIVEESELKGAMEKVSDGLIDSADESFRKTAKTVLGTYLELLAYKYAKYGEAQAAVAGYKALSESQTSKITAGLKNINPENAVSAPTEIVGPIVDQLTYTQNEDLNDILIGLLIAAGSKETQHLTHPSLIVAAKSLSADEAIILKEIAKQGENPGIPMLRVESVDERPGMHRETVVRAQYYCFINKTVKLDFAENIDMYMENMESLGLFRYVDGFYPDNKKVNDKNIPHKQYEWLRTGLEKEFVPHKPEATLRIANVMFQVTPKGQKLLESMNKIELTVN